MKERAERTGQHATIEIAYAWRKMSSTRAGVEIGLRSCDETVSSCVLVQKIESPTLVISGSGACRSKRKISTLATASRISVARKRNDQARAQQLVRTRVSADDGADLGPVLSQRLTHDPEYH